LSSRIQEVFPEPKKTYKAMEISIFGSGKRISTEFDFRTGKYMKTWTTKKEK
jgi:predicted nucleotidyltransferase